MVDTLHTSGTVSSLLLWMSNFLSRCSLQKERERPVSLLQPTRSSSRSSQLVKASGSSTSLLLTSERTVNWLSFPIVSGTYLILLLPRLSSTNSRSSPATCVRVPTRRAGCGMYRRPIRVQERCGRRAHAWYRMFTACFVRSLAPELCGGVSLTLTLTLPLTLTRAVWRGLSNSFFLHEGEHDTTYKSRLAVPSGNFAAV